MTRQADQRTFSRRDDDAHAGVAGRPSPAKPCSRLADGRMRPTRGADRAAAPGIAALSGRGPTAIIHSIGNSRPNKTP